MPAQKIATCCYCGTRAALVLTGKDRHELACSSCGAPLHDLKMLKRDHPEDRMLVKPSRVRRAPTPPAQATGGKRRGKGKRKSLKRRIFEEAWDMLEDIFD